MQEYTGIFPSKFNYNKKLPLIGTVVPLRFCERKKFKKIQIFDYSFFPIRRRIILYYYITTSKFASIRVYLDKELVINTVVFNLFQIFLFQEFEN
jgi:hypothetical protein